MDIDQFDFDLPEELIAIEPLAERSSSQLIHMDKHGQIVDRAFKDVINLIGEGDLLVFNDTKVIKARVVGNIGEAKAEITLIKKLHTTEGKNIWQVLAKPGRKFKSGRMFHVKDSFSAEILDKQDDGIITLKFDCDDPELFSLLEKHGSMPLPPYIEKKRKADSSDDSRYQTVFAKKEGAVAAPTAGLHFTDELLEKLKQKGVKTASVTLHVGAGTFLPVRVGNIKEHKMHSEYYEISQETADEINKTKASGGRVIAVGTTSLRALESSVRNKDSKKVEEVYEETDIFIYPGYKFKIVDCLVTNFHLPKSTLFMLIAAFSGLDNVKKMYAHAVERRYRFFSYGDSCFLEKSDIVQS